MTLDKMTESTRNKKNLINNLNDFIVKIDYFDQKGIKKHKNEIPLRYILNSNKSINKIII